MNILKVPNIKVHIMQNNVDYWIILIHLFNVAAGKGGAHLMTSYTAG